jgi:uncharacterized membrane protein YeaQ/YmgE (transglycosylase-associated protein family)
MARCVAVPSMDTTSLLSFIAIGAIAGALMRVLARGDGLGMPANILVGIIGAVTAGWLFDSVEHAAGVLVSATAATLGAVGLLLLTRWLQHRL